MSVPSAREREDHLLLLFFGATPKPPLARCVRRAYLDFGRTLHGMGSHPGSRALHDRASQALEERLGALLLSSAVSSQAEFDAWHRQLTEEICALHGQAGFNAFAVGQGQKWINMAFKYAVIFGEDRITGTARLFRWLHVPIDNIILHELKARGGPGLKTPWSRLEDYGEYLLLQQWIRDACPDRAPLAVEFEWWAQGISKGEGEAAEQMGVYPELQREADVSPKDAGSSSG
jgi:hypothetical protein